MAYFSWLDETMSTSATSGSMTITCPCKTVFNRIKIRVAPSTNTTGVAFHMVIKDSTANTYTSESIAVSSTTANEFEDYVVNIPFTSAGNTTVTLQFVSEKSCKAARVAMTDDNKILSGLGAKVATTWGFQMLLDVELADGEGWLINEELGIPVLAWGYEDWPGFARRANGKAYNMGVWYIDPIYNVPVLNSMDTSNFSDIWSRDKWGYPLNPAVWKIDFHNDGCPWIWGYAQREVIANMVINKIGKLAIKGNKKLVIRKESNN